MVLLLPKPAMPEAQTSFFWGKHSSMPLTNIHTVCGDVQIRIDLEQLFFQSICFIHAHMAQQILLAIQIGQVYTVKVNEVQMSHPKACQSESNIGTKSATNAS